jgi:hypothetical protein
MVDVFLMGTSGNFNDPNRSKWREPIKDACAKVGITCFDPVVPEWNEQAMKAEVEALRNARVIAMAVTADTAGIASLAESGWAALSAIRRKQAFGIYVDSMFVAEGLDPHMSVASIDLVGLMMGKGKAEDPQVVDQLAESSRRARKLVDGHAHELAKQFPELNLYVAESLAELRKWTVETALRMRLSTSGD